MVFLNNVVYSSCSCYYFIASWWPGILRSSPVAKFQEKFYKEHKDAWMVNVVMNPKRNHGQHLSQCKAMIFTFAGLFVSHSVFFVSLSLSLSIYICSNKNHTRFDKELSRCIAIRYRHIPFCISMPEFEGYIITQY